MSVMGLIPGGIGGILAVAGTGSGFGYGLKALLDHKRNYIKTLLERVGDLEDKNDASENLCEAKLAVVRHEVHNANSCLDALLMIFDMLPEDVLPDRAKRAIADTRARRIEQEGAISIERAKVHEAIVELAQRGLVDHEKAEKI